MMKIGTASFIKEYVLKRDLLMSWPNLGTRISGISMIRGDRLPGSSLAARRPAARSWKKISPNTVAEAVQGSPLKMVNMTAKSGEHGIPSKSRKIAIFFSFFVSSMRVVSIAMVIQEKPITSGSTPLPFRPIFDRTLFKRTDILERYPESSSNPKKI